MPLDIQALLKEAEGQNYALHREHINPRFAKVLRLIGFDRCYVRAKGPYLWDEAGTRYLDLISGYGVFALGRNHPEVRRALQEFMALDHPSLVQMEAPVLSGLLARELKRRVPEGLERVYFSNSGTEGVEAAIKFARCATHRPAILYCHKAFHGLTNGSLALNGDETFREGFAPFLPQCRAIPFNDLPALEQALAGNDVAAFVVEPIQGKGVNLPEPGYLGAAAALCRRRGALFVVDEVQTGVGRTGRFLAIDHEPGLEPDILILSKALSGGYVPVGAVLMRRPVYDKVFSSLERAVVHSSTFGQASLAMVAALATLRVLDEEGLVERAERMGRRLLQGLEAMVGHYPFLKEVRGRGLMVGIELGPPSTLGLKTAWAMVHRLDRSLFPQALIIPLLDEHHMITQVAGHHMDVIKLLPPLVVEEQDIEDFLAAFEQVLAGLERFPGPAWDVLTRIGRFSLGQRDAGGGGS
jgi:acetylornithine/succinyldiaminopimelate/putrescine aminotransferase